MKLKTVEVQGEKIYEFNSEESAIKYLESLKNNKEEVENELQDK